MELHLADAGWYARAAERWEPGRPGSRAELERAAAAARRRAKYARARVESLSRHVGPRAARCGQQERWIRCGCAGGAAQPIPARCNVRGVCVECDRRRGRRMRRRMVAAVTHHQRAARAARRSATVRLLTLTVAHSGDLARDRAELVKGWQQLRKQLHRWWGRVPPFALVWETTAGADGRGHEHAHVLVIGGPGWWPYAAMRRVWMTACPRSKSLQIDAVRGGAAGAARYVSKYVTKGIDHAAGWSDELTAQWLAAHYGARMVATSRGFWTFHVERRPCASCGECYRVAERPSTWELARRELLRRSCERWIEGEPDPLGPRTFHVEHEPRA